MVCHESLSPRGHFPSGEELTRSTGEGRDPKVAGGVWEERDMRWQSRRSTTGGPSMERASQHRLSCRDQLSSAASPVTWGSNPASPRHLLSPRIKSPWTHLDKLKCKAGAYPTQLHLGRIPQANTEGKGRDRQTPLHKPSVTGVCRHNSIFSPYSYPALFTLMLLFRSLIALFSKAFV